jgi:sugar (pentulose or hexulose) kinase
VSLLGIDLGTSGIRVAAFDEDGDELASVSRPRALTRPAPGRVETDAEACLTDVIDLVRHVLSAAAVEADPVDGLSFSVQGEAVVPVDRHGRALAPAPVSMDRRGVEMVERIAGTLGRDHVQDVTGQPVHPMFSLYKIAAEGAAWGMPSVFGLRCLGDFVATRLGAEPVMDTTMAARTGAFDVDRGSWSAELLDAAGIGVQLMPRVVLPGTVIGAVSEDIAATTGLRTGVPIIVGSHDQAASYWGAGGRPGQASVYAFGSSDCLTVGSSARPPLLGGTGLATYPVADDVWLTLAGTAAGGWALEWFTDLVGAGSPAERDAILAAASDKPADVVVLPYLAGSGTLDNDTSATGAVVGLTLGTTRDELARGFLEAAGYELRKIVAALGQRGLTTGDVLAVGSGAESPKSLAIRAAAAGRPMSAVSAAASLRGAAMQAAVGLGIHPSLSTVPAPKRAHTAVPDPSTTLWFDAQGARYADLYRALIPLHPTIAKENR